MKFTYLFLIAGLVALSGGPTPAQGSYIDGVELTTIKAPWAMRILGNDLDLTRVQAKPDQQSAYFMLVSDSQKLNVSVFIERADKCKSGEECRDYVLDLGNPGWGKYQDLAKGKIKEFSYFEFYRPEVKGQPVKMLDMYAQYVGEGYWIDLHISKVLYTKEDHKLFENVVNSVSFVPKGPSQNTLLDNQKASGERSVGAWLDLWDQRKCRESFDSLSPLTKIDNTEKSWVEYCTQVNSTLGSKKSRNLIALAYTKSIPPKTDQPVAIHAYHSSFENRPSIVEIVALVKEQKGNWVVTNYLPQ